MLTSADFWMVRSLQIGASLLLFYKCLLSAFSSNSIEIDLPNEHFNTLLTKVGIFLVCKSKLNISIFHKFRVVNKGRWNK
jgi:hypothetical protein